MATGVSSTHNTEDLNTLMENIHACCSPCKESDRNTRARHYCVDCEMYFCAKCLKDHNKFPSLKSHQVNDVQSSDATDTADSVQSEEASGVPPEVMKCTIHPDKLIDTHCKDHDDICCEVCAVVKHRQCTTGSIETAAKDYKSKPEANQCKQELTELLGKFKKEKQKRTDNINHIENVKLEIIKNADNYEDHVIAKVKILADASRNDVRSKLETRKNADCNDIESFDIVITNTELLVTNLEQLDDESLFRHVKMGKIVTKDLSSLLRALSDDWRKTAVEINFDKTLENMVDGMKSLGELVESKYTATFQDNVNVKQDSDKKVNVIADMCKMDSGDLIMIDHSNRKLKRFNGNFKFIDEICLSGMPIAVCTISKKEVAVRIWESKVVHTVSVGESMQLVSAFTLADNGRGMTYDACTGELLVCEEDKVSVYNTTGTKLRTYDTNTNGEKMFAACRQILLNMNQQKIYVTDDKKGLVILDKNGMLITYVTVDITDPWALCLLPGGVCLVGCHSEGTFVQIKGDVNKVRKMINGIDEHAYTNCALYDDDHTRLIIGGKSANVCVYTLS